LTLFDNEPAEANPWPQAVLIESFKKNIPTGRILKEKFTRRQNLAVKIIPLPHR
jgi:hypothetical protein